MSGHPGRSTSALITLTSIMPVAIHTDHEPCSMRFFFSLNKHTHAQSQLKCMVSENTRRASYKKKKGVKAGKWHVRLIEVTGREREKKIKKTALERPLLPLRIETAQHATRCPFQPAAHRQSGGSAGDGTRPTQYFSGRLGLYRARRGVSEFNDGNLNPRWFRAAGLRGSA